MKLKITASVTVNTKDGRGTPEEQIARLRANGGEEAFDVLSDYGKYPPAEAGKFTVVVEEVNE